MNVDDLPCETIQKIFSNLNWSDLKSCAAVSKTWETIANDTSEAKWRIMCKSEFGSVYEEAHRKSQLSWEELYKSLKLWPQIKSSKIFVNYIDLEEKDGYVGSIDPDDGVKRIQVMKDGIIGYPRYTEREDDSDHGSFMTRTGRWGSCNSISYYDPEMLVNIDERVYNFKFDVCEENDDLIVFRRSNLNLYIETKANRRIHHIGEMLQYEWGDFSKFYLVKNKVFYLSKDYKIWICKLVYENGEATIQSAEFAEFKLFPALHKIIAFAYINDDQVNVLTCRGHIFSIVDQELHQLCHVRKNMDNRNEVVNMLKEHGFDWSTQQVYRWICDHDIIDGDWVAITHLKHAIVRSYGCVVIIGTVRRTLHIYYNPYQNGQLKLYNRKPTLAIDLNKYIQIQDELRWMPSSHRQIIQIDVMEIENGHRVILLYCQKLVSIDFINYPPKRPGEPLANVAVRPRIGSSVHTG